MGKSNFTDEFKRDEVRQITERGYPVAEVSQRLGVSAHSLYEWRKKYAGTVETLLPHCVAIASIKARPKASPLARGQHSQKFIS